MTSEIATNVVRLPTAAKRKVRQRWNGVTRGERKRLPQFTGEYILPCVRAAIPMAKALREVRKSATAEMELLAAICLTLDDEARARVARMLTIGADEGQRSSIQALAVLRASKMTYGEVTDLRNAFRILDSEAPPIHHSRL